MNLDTKSWAKILLVVAMLNIARLIAVFFQTRFLLVSPLIPGSTITEVAAPILFKALIATLAVAVAMVFYFYSRYRVCVVICGGSLFVPVATYYVFF